MASLINRTLISVVLLELFLLCLSHVNADLSINADAARVSSSKLSKRSPIGPSSSSFWRKRAWEGLGSDLCCTIPGAGCCKAKRSQPITNEENSISEQQVRETEMISVASPIIEADDQEITDKDISRNKRAFAAGAWDDVPNIPNPHKKRQYEGIFITDGSQKRSWDALGIPDKRSWDALGIPDRRSWDALGIPDRRSLGLNGQDAKALASFFASRQNRRQ